MLSDPRLELIKSAHRFYRQGWMVGTAGNLSARLPDGSVWITASGRSKGELTLDDFVRVAIDGSVIESAHANVKASAETAIHRTLYTLFPDAQACFHVHSVEANVVSRFVQDHELRLPPLEMLKGLGVWQEKPQCVMPIFTNHLNIIQVAEDVQTWFQTNPPQVPALLIRDHGVTVWAPSLVDARNYIELVEFIFRYMVFARQAGL